MTTKTTGRITTEIADIAAGLYGPIWQMPRAKRVEIINAFAATGCRNLDAEVTALVLQLLCLEVALQKRDAK